MEGFLPDALAWLVDAPLFIDAESVSRFHDAILQPEYAEGVTTLTFDKESVSRLAGKIGAKGEVSPGKLAALIKPVFAFVNFKLGGDIELEGDVTKSDTEARSIQLHPIRTPQRQLVQLVLYYVANHGDRLELVTDLASSEWRDATRILRSPRTLAFVDVPKGSLIVPTAAEFANGHVVPIYSTFRDANGEEPPIFPDGPGEEFTEERLRYWSWFSQNVQPKKAMEAIETAAKDNGGKIRWIDYRIMLDNRGSSFHLHVCPAETFDVGVFAYNLAYRGCRHGLRLVGTLKSEPDMNVLAVYEK